MQGGKHTRERNKTAVLRSPVLCNVILSYWKSQRASLPRMWQTLAVVSAPVGKENPPVMSQRADICTLSQVSDIVPSQVCAPPARPLSSVQGPQVFEHVTHEWKCVILPGHTFCLDERWKK